MTPIDRIKLEFDFDRLLAEDGFHFNPKRSVKQSSGDYDYKIYHKLDAGNKPYITYQRGWGPGGDQVYINLGDSTDRGSVIDYLQKHHQLSFKEIFAFVEQFEGKKIAPLYSSSQAPSKRTKVIYKICSTSPVTKSKLLHDRHLHDILFHDRFNDSIVACNVKSINDSTGKVRNFQALGFPLINADNKIQAYTLKSTQLSSIFSGPRRGSLWISRLTDGPIFISEAVFDAMSHYSLMPNDYTYVSTEGRFSNSFIPTLKTLIPNLTSRTILLGNDNDLDGYLYDFQWIQGIFDLPFSASKFLTNPELTNVEFSRFIIIKTNDTRFSEILHNQYGSTPHCNEQQRYIKENVFSSVFRTICYYYGLTQCIQSKSRLKDYSDDLVWKANHNVNVQ